MEATIADVMEAYAADAVEYAASQGKELDYSPQSIADVEVLADRLHKSMPRSFLARLFRRAPSPEVVATFAKMLGAYVGEVVRREKGGEWTLHSAFETYALEFPGDTAIFPVAKAHKRLLNGPEDNLQSFYIVFVDDILTGKLKRETSD